MSIKKVPAQGMVDLLTGTFYDANDKNAKTNLHIFTQKSTPATSAGGFLCMPEVMGAE